MTWNLQANLVPVVGTTLKVPRSSSIATISVAPLGAGAGLLSGLARRGLYQEEGIFFDYVLRGDCDAFAWPVSNLSRFSHFPGKCFHEFLTAAR